MGVCVAGEERLEEGSAPSVISPGEEEPGDSDRGEGEWSLLEPGPGDTRHGAPSCDNQSEVSINHHYPPITAHLEGLEAGAGAEHARHLGRGALVGQLPEEAARLAPLVRLALLVPQLGRRHVPP